MAERQTHELFVEFMRMCQRERDTKLSNNHHIDRESQALAETQTILKIYILLNI